MNHLRHLSGALSAFAASTLVAGLLSTGNICAAAPTDSTHIRHERLQNGLEIYIWPDHDIPNAALYLWYRVGSRNETPSRTGLSHFFEHMMFNGAKKYGPGEFDRVLEDAGGNNNAFTSTDVTTYQDWFPASELALVLDLEADRIANLGLEPAKVESERGVVYSERRTSVDNNPHALLDEHVRATAFLAHPYGIPTIGWPSDIETWTIGDLRTHFLTYYAPNNCTLVLVGAIDPEPALKTIRRTLGRLKRGPAIPEVRATEPLQRGQRRIAVSGPAQLTVLELAFHSPRPADETFAAWELMDSVLADGESSRLWRRLVEREQLAIDVSTALDEGFDPGLYTIVLTLQQGADVARAEAAVFEELESLARTGPSEDELGKARRLQETSLYRLLQTIDGRAYALGHFALFRGGIDALFKVTDTWRATTTSEIARSASELRSDRATVGILLPAEGGEEQP